MQQYRYLFSYSNIGTGKGEQTSGRTDFTLDHYSPPRSIVMHGNDAVQYRHGTAWVIGSPGQWVIWVIFHVLVTVSSFSPGVRPEFSRFSKKMPKMQSVHLKC